MIRIGITGPESSGKTTLSKALAEHYNVDFIEEYGRQYLEEKEGSYIQSDLDKIAEGHLKNIQLAQNLSERNKIQIVDTDFTVLKIWSSYKYNNVSGLITELVERPIFDLHILCTPDMPWEEDVLRENPDDRDALFEIYRTTLKDLKRKFIIVDSTHSERLKKSVLAIDAILI